jgi:hypothetical protein
LASCGSVIGANWLAVFHLIGREGELELGALERGAGGAGNQRSADLGALDDLDLSVLSVISVDGHTS